MITIFSKKELEQLVFKEVERRALSQAYIDEREKVWLVEMEKTLARGDSMWNGEIYTVEHILQSGEEQVQFLVSTCEYKDVVFRFVKGAQHLLEKYGRSVLFHGIGVAFIPLTADDRFIFGIRGDFAMGGTHPIGLIGGNLNKDEMVVRNFTDLRAFALKEIEEETVLEVSPEKLHFVAMSYERHLYQFLFAARLPYAGDVVEQLNKPGEFSRMVAMNQKEVCEVQIPLSGSFAYWRDHLNLVLDKVDEGY
jgi:hypothetical protein